MSVIAPVDTPVLAFETQRSALDASVNFIVKTNPGMLEARFVQRKPESFIVYLSSQTGCTKACRMCHLTQTGQTDSRNTTIAEYFAQADVVLQWYDAHVQPAKVVHFNFMARGEAFANTTLLEHADELLDGLVERATTRGLVPRVKISTIAPTEIADLDFTDIFKRHTPDLYYSIYSVDPAFRRRWLPKSLPVDAALGKLQRWQMVTRKLPKLHWAFIEGENDSLESVSALAQKVGEYDLRADINIVRYNPYSDRQGQEPSEEVIERNADYLRTALPGSRVKVIERVGFDVKASCGMFVKK